MHWASTAPTEAGWYWLGCDDGACDHCLQAMFVHIEEGVATVYVGGEDGGRDQPGVGDSYWPDPRWSSEPIPQPTEGGA